MDGMQNGVISSAEHRIGFTPLIRLFRLEKAMGIESKILAKAEGMNPGGSAKDRAALYMIRDAEKKGMLSPGGVIIEPTSGNTGVALAMLVAARGYRAVIVMPDSMSVERQRLMRAYGAQVVLTPGKEGMQGAIEKARALQREIPGSFIPDQFNNAANALAHYETTGPEIWQDTKGQMDIFVAGVGTGGTLTGAGRYLREKHPGLHIAAVEPYDSPVLSGGKPGFHGIQGIGAGFIPGVLDTGIYDEVILVKTVDAVNALRLLAEKEGLLCGISSGAALCGAMQLSGRPENAGKTIVTILPDTGERYLSAGIFDE